MAAAMLSISAAAPFLRGRIISPEGGLAARRDERRSDSAFVRSRYRIRFDRRSETLNGSPG